MQYILNETEYQELVALKDQNSYLSNELEAACLALEENRKKDKEVMNLYKLSIKERDERITALKEACNLHNKKLAEQAHELLVKEAELADLSSKVRSLMKEKQTYCNQIAEMKRDYEGTAQALKEAQELSAKYLTLTQEIRQLRDEHVCVAQNPRTGTVRVISVSRADIYRQHGWTVSDEYIVDRPA